MSRQSTALAIAAVTMAVIAGPGSASAAPVTFLEKQQSGEWLAHRLVGTKVLNAQAEAIGEVKDVVLDRNNVATTVVIGVGGFLGIPEKLVAVPINVIQIGDVVQSSRIVVLDATKEALKAAPAYSATDPAMPDRVKQKASDWMSAAKAKVLELSKAASEKAKEMTAPKEGEPAPKP